MTTLDMSSSPTDRTPHVVPNDRNSLAGRALQRSNGHHGRDGMLDFRKHISRIRSLVIDALSVFEVLEHNSQEMLLTRRVFPQRLIDVVAIKEQILRLHVFCMFPHLPVEYHDGPIGGHLQTLGIPRPWSSEAPMSPPIWGRQNRGSAILLRDHGSSPPVKCRWRWTMRSFARVPPHPSLRAPARIFIGVQCVAGGCGTWEFRDGSCTGSVGRCRSSSR
jgi:hypothetical protein